MPASNLSELTTELSPADLTQLQGLKLGDFGYDAIQAAARVTFRSGNVGIYIAEVDKWVAEKP